MCVGRCVVVVLLPSAGPFSMIITGRRHWWRRRRLLLLQQNGRHRYLCLRDKCVVHAMHNMFVLLPTDTGRKRCITIVTLMLADSLVQQHVLTKRTVQRKRFIANFTNGPNLIVFRFVSLQIFQQQKRFRTLGTFKGSRIVVPLQVFVQHICRHKLFATLIALIWFFACKSNSTRLCVINDREIYNFFCCSVATHRCGCVDESSNNCWCNSPCCTPHTHTAVRRYECSSASLAHTLS